MVGKHLYIVHCGFYDPKVTAGLYEGHTNFLIAAGSLKEARVIAKEQPEFERMRMHVDGVQEILAVQGHEVILKKRVKLKGKTKIRLMKYGSRVASEREL